MGLYILFHEYKLREAERLLVLSAEQGYVNAQGWLGSFYLDGDFGSVDTGKAIHWFSQAAKQGSLIDAYTLAELYFEGEKIAENDREALRWYEFVANGSPNFEKYSNACIATASYYIYAAKGINVDFSKAKKYALKAFESGEKRLSSYYLGQLSTRGFGNQTDDFKNCFKWMFISANEGHPKAQNMVR
ncbi:sel1 repeat family protein [Porphyromonas gingivalis]|nr:tetratricopeptide repeat protein [Porphyromonas gingivalis]MDP0532230.1 sel1 repeat family protein [Porphyromonas gingivalis]